MKTVIGFLLGIVAQLTFLSAPVHEFGHWSLAFLMGIPAKMRWGSTTFYGSLSNGEFMALSWAGVTFETVSFALLALAFNRKKKYSLTAFFLAASITAYITAGTYTDIVAVQREGLLFWYFIGMVMFFFIVRKFLSTGKGPSKAGIFRKQV